MATRKYKLLVAAYNIVTDHHPKWSDGERFALTLKFYNKENKNDPADLSDLIDALEHGQD